MAPMKPVYLIHYHEVALKGRNRPWFEKRLVRNLKRALAPLAPVRVRRLYGRILVDGLDAIDPAAVADRMRRVFGVASFARAHEIERDLDRLGDAVVEEIGKRSFQSFAVRARRSDKSFPVDSPSIGRDLGARIVQATGATVDLGHPDLAVHVEVLHEGILFSFEKSQGAGGLPVGASGRLLCLLSGGIDSPVAAYRMLRRGSNVGFVHFHSYPFTGLESLEKVMRLIETLNLYQASDRVTMVPLGETQQQIAASTPERLRVLLYRRFMVRIAERLAVDDGSQALVTGESLAQVASQTLENLIVVEDSSALPILRPLIGLDKQEIIQTAREIGTYETSIEAHDDCCSFLMPRQPATRAKIGDLREAEKLLPVEDLVNRAIDESQEQRTQTDR